MDAIASPDALPGLPPPEQPAMELAIRVKSNNVLSTHRLGFFEIIIQ
jgi:hypothetical protein